MSDSKQKSIAEKMFNKFVKPYADKANVDATKLPTATKNQIITTALNFFYLEGTQVYFGEGETFWKRWESGMPENVADTLQMTIGNVNRRPYDENYFIPTAQLINRTYEQIINTNTRQVFDYTIPYKIAQSAFGSPVAFEGYLSKLMLTLKQKEYEYYFYNLLEYLLKSTPRPTTSTDLIDADFFKNMQQGADSGVLKTFTSTQTTFNNIAFTELLAHLKRLTIPLQTNYNIGDVTDTDGKQIYNFGYPHTNEKMSDFILIAPNSIMNEYMTNTSNTEGIPNVFNINKVDLNEFINNIYYYDDTSPQVAVDVANPKGGMNIIQMVANPLLGLTTMCVLNKNACLVKTRINENANQMFVGNLTGYHATHLWTNTAINQTAQGFKFNLKAKTSNSPVKKVEATTKSK